MLSTVYTTNNVMFMYVMILCLSYNNISLIVGGGRVRRIVVHFWKEAGKICNM